MTDVRITREKSNKWDRLWDEKEVNMSEQEIWKREREELEGLGHEDLVEELICRYRPMVYAAARRLAPWLRQDEDLLQCGLIGLWKAAEEWDEERPFPPLARRCIENEMTSYLRQLRRQTGQLPAVPLRREEEGLLYEEDWSAVETRDTVERATAPHSRERALLLAVADGYSVTEAARRLGISRQTAQRKLRRSGRRLGLDCKEEKSGVK